MQRSSLGNGNVDLLRSVLEQDFVQLRFLEGLLQEARTRRDPDNVAVICSKIAVLVNEMRDLLGQLPPSERSRNERDIASVENNIAMICTRN